ncbi:hypothetical protein G9A89_004520 [Geosiphon pyriformis]|nr:hypothetical protein G9A89_004520 [Geosiphon pyriformis]
MLQNDSKKTYIIEPNEKITQAIFLPLVKIAQLVSVENREELGITAKEIQGFGSMSRIDVPINMAEEKIVDKEEIISTCQSISISSYDQYMVVIKRKNKESGDIIKIPEGTTIGYLITKIEDQLPNAISDFPQLCEYVDITSQTIYG